MRLPLFLFLLVLVPSVLAIGVSPPTVYIDYVPGKTYEFSVNVINYNSFPITAAVGTDGEYKENIKVKQPIRIAPMGATPAIITFTAPDVLDRPGHHTSYVSFTEDFFDENTGTFGARTAVQMRLIMWQPYPGHYADIIASAPSVSQGSDTSLKVVVNNLGVEPVEKATATVRVVSAQNALMDVITITDVNLAGNTNTAYNRLLKSSAYPPGRYTLAATLDYGTNTSQLNTTFVVGTEKVEAIALEGPFYLDRPVNKFLVHAESLWNLPINNVFAVVELGESVSQTPTAALEPFGKTALDGYWETDKTIMPGQVIAKVTMHYSNATESFLIPVTVYNESPRVAAEPEEPTLVLSGADVLFIMGVLIIVLCLVLFALNKHFGNHQ
jgi:hypothetical protein